MNFFRKIYAFFASPNTPGSAFYAAMVPMLSSVGDYFLGSGNPVMMGIGAAISGVYALAHYVGNGIASKQGPVVAAISTGPLVANETAFGTPKVGADYPAPDVTVAPAASATIAHPF